MAAKLARRCEVQMAYVIGVPEPVSVAVDTFNTGAIDDVTLAELVRQLFNLRPKGIIETLQLRRPIYRPTATYGHFGRSPEDGTFTWEKTDRANDLSKAAEKR